MYSAVMLPQARNLTHLVSGLQAQSASQSALLVNSWTDDMPPWCPHAMRFAKLVA